LVAIALFLSRRDYSDFLDCQIAPVNGVESLSGRKIRQEHLEEAAKHLIDILRQAEAAPCLLVLASLELPVRPLLYVPASACSWHTNDPQIVRLA
jgi:hypothetical protein